MEWKRVVRERMFPGGTDQITNTAIVMVGSRPRFDQGISRLQVRNARTWTNILRTISLYRQTKTIHNFGKGGYSAKIWTEILINRTPDVWSSHDLGNNDASINREWSTFDVSENPFLNVLCTTVLQMYVGHMNSALHHERNGLIIISPLPIPRTLWRLV
jgi:hypothetical protein